MKNTYIVIPALKPGPGLAGEVRELGRRLCARITRRHLPWQREWRAAGSFISGRTWGKAGL